MTWIVAFGLLAVFGGVHSASTGCKNCIILGKEEKAMFRAHSDACLPQSEVDPKLVEAMLNGELTEDPALKRHVYCVLLKCKVVGKDGKLHKTAVLGKMAARADGKNATKVLEGCAEQSGDTPEDIAWKLFRCGYDKKAVLFEYMPTNLSSDIIENNS
ncbi:pheromone-binding protein-related protein 6-like [Ostrinia nubilalis]|uniref:pheromone-binding protein-related protein 6-like n=1 Tax=Ostrinia nubilalis TaxID=29057 RepID=UPI00308224BA